MRFFFTSYENYIFIAFKSNKVYFIAFESNICDLLFVSKYSEEREGAREVCWECSGEGSGKECVVAGRGHIHEQRSRHSTHGSR
jgi:hypothetical protein